MTTATLIAEKEVETKTTPKKVWELKALLKDLASEIKQTRIDFKNAQRERTGKFDMCGGLYYWVDTTPRETLQKEWKLQSKLELLKRDYRHKHIAYCLLRGTAYEAIEKICGMDNSPNWSVIEGVKNVYGSF